MHTQQIKKELLQASEHFIKLANVFLTLKNSGLAEHPAVTAELEDLTNAMKALSEQIGLLNNLSRKTNSDQIRTRPALKLVKR